MSYIVTTITKHSDYSTINGPEICISFKGQAYVSKVPGKNNIQIATIQGINMIFAIAEIVSIDGSAPLPNTDDLVEQIILAMPDVGGGGSTDLTDIENRLDAVEGRLDDIDVTLPLKADLVGGFLDVNQLPVQARTEYVNTYTDLPAANTVTGQKYGVINSQGTKWLPGSLGGTYYPKGYYYSNGVIWTYMGDFPYQATQPDVDAGIITDQFVSPATLNSTSMWNKTKVGLGNVDNTSDANKPVSNAQQTALDLKANLRTVTRTVLGGTVTMTVQSTYYTIFSVSLAPGTYDITVRCQFARTAANNTPSYNLRMGLGGTNIESISGVANVVNRHAALTLQTFGLVVGSTLTLLIEGCDTQNPNSTVAIVNQNGDSNATVLTVIKIS